MLVYLCGPITGLSYEEARNGWRAQMRQLIKPEIELLSPMRHKDYLANETNLDGGPDMYKDTLLSSGKAIVTRDRFDTTRAKMIVANFLGATRVSIGSMVEFGWADANRIPIVAIMEKGNPHDHAFVHQLAGFVVDNLDDAAFIVNSTLIPGI